MRPFELTTLVTFLSLAVIARTLNFSGICDNAAFKARETLSTPRGTCPSFFYPILLQMTKCAFYLASRRPEDVPAYPSNGIPSLQPDPSDVCDFWKWVCDSSVSCKNEMTDVRKYSVYLAAFPDLDEEAKEDPSVRLKFSRLKYEKI
ncbi:uncharacterized protein Triagg1_2640 [Trichoderma aggressivum f. europaeum]|uniref:Uncharacterized protein n=1 Tax=Trichoderma aggressivum f. europaeum TaxID=173218 RepID=A0AAE1IGD7_9HYPO|nr:hypothetical protein Triagg1_2640 [Trichoderma aggressivum f. europaeum]